MDRIFFELRLYDNMRIAIFRENAVDKNWVAWPQKLNPLDDRGLGSQWLDMDKEPIARGPDRIDVMIKALEAGAVFLRKLEGR